MSDSMDKAQFSKSFATEALLQQALAKLLERMPGVSGVRILQGTLEHGKDLIFYQKTCFDDLMLYACVVKNTKISGSVASNEGARTVYHQAKQAFDTPITTEYGIEERVQHVFIVTPFDLSTNAIESIKGELQAHQSQVTFLGGTRLFDLFRKHWPDYLVKEHEALTSYSSDLEKHLSSTHTTAALITHYNFGGFDANERNIYIPQSFVRKLPNLVETPDWSYAFPDHLTISHKCSVARLQEIVTGLEKVRKSLQAVCDWNLDVSLNKGILEINKRLGIVFECFSNAYRSASREPRGVAVTRHALGSEALVSQLLCLWGIYNDQTFEGLIPSSIPDLIENIRRMIDTYQRVYRAANKQAEWQFNDADFLKASVFDDFVTATNPVFVSLVKKSPGREIPFRQDMLDEWKGSVLIVGAAGYGKTLFCNRNALLDLERWNMGASDILPCYTPLWRWAKDKLGTFEEVFLASLGRSALTMQSEERDPRSAPKIRLYLDGLDEIPDPERRREIVALARSGAVGSNRYQVVLTARDYIYDPELNWLPRVSLSGFSSTNVSELAEAWLGKDTAALSRFNQQRADVPAFVELMRVPLLATLIILVFRQTGALPSSRVDLYEKCITLLTGGWDVVKGVLRGTRYTAKAKRIVLTHLAHQMHVNRKRESSVRIIHDAILFHFNKTIIADWKTLYNEIFMDGLLTQSGDTFQFSHLSFQEFLAADHLRSNCFATEMDELINLFLDGDDWWKEVIRFRIEMSSNPIKSFHWLYEISRKTHRKDSQFAQGRLEELRAWICNVFPGGNV